MEAQSVDLQSSAGSPVSTGPQSARVFGVIPARLESTRLPRKLLLAETGKPLIQHTWEAAKQSRSLSQLMIATDSDELAKSATRFGAQCQLTGPQPTGTDRLAEVARKLGSDRDIFVNIQGDEPEVDAENIDRLVQILVDNPAAEMATLAAKIRDPRIISDPACTKLVCSNQGRALYFSRCPIPFCRDGDLEQQIHVDSPWLLHIGVYAYRRDFLLRLAEMPRSRLEQLEQLEQLRALESGASIQVAIVEHHAPGIDTLEDYQRFLQRSQAMAA